MWVCIGVRRVIRKALHRAEGHVMTRIIQVYKGGRAFQPDTTTGAKIQKRLSTWERQVTQHCWRPRYKREGGEVLMSRVEE